MVENRSWTTKHRGPLAIYASQAFSKADMREARATCEKNGHAWPAEFPTGGVVGVVNLRGFVQGHGDDLVTENPDELPEEINLDFYQDGAVGWVMTDQKPCEFRTFKGRLSIFDIPDDLIVFND